MNLLGYKSLEEVHHAAAAATSSKIHPPVDQPDHELCLFLLMVWWLDQQFFYPPSHSPGQVDLFIARAVPSGVFLSGAIVNQHQTAWNTSHQLVQLIMIQAEPDIG